MAELKSVSLEKIRIPEVRVSSILNPEQQALMSSTIKEIGVVQDIVVRDLGDEGYELVAGKSRLEELRKLGVAETEVKVIRADEKLGLLMNIIENIARGTFDYISVARSIRKLRELGATAEELEKIFPWKQRWIQFIEDLQDLPDDVQEALRTKSLTPTHVQLALNLPTPYEVHDGLRTAITHGWDTGTFRTFVQNRVEQVERAKRRAAEMGTEPEIPPARPQELIRYRQCLLCGYKKPVDQVTTQLVCDGCTDLIGYICSQLGPPEEAIKTVYDALRAFYGQLQPGVRIPAGPPTTGGGAPPPLPTPPTPSLSPGEVSVRIFHLVEELRKGLISEDQARGYLLSLRLDPREVDRILSRVR